MERRSCKRDAIIRDLRSRNDHPTADMVFASVQKIYPSISLGTVYRNLEELTRSGDIVRIDTEGKERYDGHLQPHGHFYCIRCGSLTDVPFSLKNGELNRIEETVGTPVINYEISFRGICKECRAKENK